MDNQEFELASLIMSQMSAGDPIRYANLMRATKSKEIEQIRTMLPVMRTQLQIYEETAKKANEFRKQVSGEGYARRRKDSKKIFEGLDQQQDFLRSTPVDISSVISYHYESVLNIQAAMVRAAEYIVNAKMISIDQSIDQLSTDLAGHTDQLGEDRVKALFGKAKEDTSNALQSLALEQQVNRGASTAFVQGLSILEKVPKMFETYLVNQSRNYEAYYDKLRQRHSSGMVICDLIDTKSVTKSVTLTDVALLVWENIDKVGEIESGTKKDELSAYTLHRANAMIEAAKHGEVWNWIVDPGKQILTWVDLIAPTIKSVLNFVIKFKQMLGEQVWNLLTLDIDKVNKEFTDIIDSLDLSQITERTSEKAFSKTEKFAIDHRNKSVQKVANLLVVGEGLNTIVEQILELKIEERNYFMLENSFYVCKIGTGNMFTGEAPGALEIFPGEKPHANLDHIWGGGFDEIRDFIAGMDEAKKWNNLFLATSPSGTTDKNNMLLIGPQGCGKTLLMKALGSAADNISVFAIGSDFGTAWAHESNKNPKRLFEAAISLHKASGRQVYILIDEIDMILNNDRSVGNLNLSLEFQNLMDGLVSYPGLTLIGATNNPDRIPTPMLRRFAKVMVVGELSQDNIVAILRHYIETFLPCNEDFTDAQYVNWAIKLEGATGDALRKAVDDIWLKFMRNFVINKKEVAQLIIDFLQTEYGSEFDISTLSDDNRSKIKEMIKNSGEIVTPETVTAHVESLLENSAVRKQIQVAKDTYRAAKQTLDKQKTGDKGLGF